MNHKSVPIFWLFEFGFILSDIFIAQNDFLSNNAPEFYYKKYFQFCSFFENLRNPI